MVWYMSALSYIWSMLTIWLSTIFVTPFRNLDMLWLLVPIWLSWFFSEFFQEKQGTSMGNAITNAVVILWGSIDCTRQTVYLIMDNTLTGTLNIVIRFVLVGIIFAYGIIIVILGLKGNKIIKYLGRVREVTYVFAMFVPVFYNTIPFSIKHIISFFIFAPLFYFAIELIDKYAPNPKAVDEDIQQATGLGNTEKSSTFDNGGSEMGGGLGGFGGNDSSLGSPPASNNGLGDFKF